MAAVVVVVVVHVIVVAIFSRYAVFCSFSVIGQFMVSMDISEVLTKGEKPWCDNY